MQILQNIMQCKKWMLITVVARITSLQVQLVKIYLCSENSLKTKALLAENFVVNNAICDAILK